LILRTTFDMVSCRPQPRVTAAARGPRHGDRAHGRASARGRESGAAHLLALRLNSLARPVGGPRNPHPGAWTRRVPLVRGKGRDVSD
jgi:hypothetical protein